MEEKTRLEKYLEQIKVRVTVHEEVVREALKVARENERIRKAELEEVRQYFMGGARTARRKTVGRRRGVK